MVGERRGSGLGQVTRVSNTRRKGRTRCWYRRYESPESRVREPVFHTKVDHAARVPRALPKGRGPIARPRERLGFLPGLERLDENHATVLVVALLALFPFLLLARCRARASARTSAARAPPASITSSAALLPRTQCRERRPTGKHRRRRRREIEPSRADGHERALVIVLRVRPTVLLGVGVGIHPAHGNRRTLRQRVSRASSARALTTASRSAASRAALCFSPAFAPACRLRRALYPSEARRKDPLGTVCSWDRRRAPRSTHTSPPSPPTLHPPPPRRAPPPRRRLGNVGERHAARRVSARTRFVAADPPPSSKPAIDLVAPPEDIPACDGAAVRVGRISAAWERPGVRKNRRTPSLLRARMAHFAPPIVGGMLSALEVASIVAQPTIVRPLVAWIGEPDAPLSEGIAFGVGFVFSRWRRPCSTTRTSTRPCAPRWNLRIGMTGMVGDTCSRSPRARVRDGAPDVAAHVSRDCQRFDNALPFLHLRGSRRLSS